MNFPPVSIWLRTNYGYEANAIGLITNLGATYGELPKRSDNERTINGYSVINMDGYRYAVRETNRNLTRFCL